MQLAANAGLQDDRAERRLEDRSDAQQATSRRYAVPSMPPSPDVSRVLAVYQLSSVDSRSTTQRAPRSASYAAALVKGTAVRCATVFVGNEPNLNLFWQPQFDS